MTNQAPTFIPIYFFISSIVLYLIISVGFSMIYMVERSFEEGKEEEDSWLA